MRLYHWGSEALRNWSHGDIVVMAANVTEARETAVRVYKELDGSNMKQFELDIAERPTSTSKPSALLFYGSD